MKEKGEGHGVGPPVCIVFVYMVKPLIVEEVGPRVAITWRP